MITIEVDVVIEKQIDVEASINGFANITITTEGGEPPIDIDSLDGGDSSDTVYAPVNANGLTGISGGTP